MTDAELNAEELAALDALLRAHPHYGRRALTIAECLRSRHIGAEFKARYRAIWRRRYPHIETA